MRNLLRTAALALAVVQPALALPPSVSPPSMSPTASNATAGALANLGVVQAANRAPTPADDLTRGYIEPGMLSTINAAAKGSGYTAATVAVAAPPAGGLQAVAQPIFYSGAIIGYSLTCAGCSRGRGYISAPAVTVTGNGTGATALATPATSGSLWSIPGRTWRMVDGTPGLASWEPTGVTALPCDTIPAASLTGGACYGAIKLRSAYAGYAFRLTRTSDSTTKDIGFLANGQVDAASADGFCINDALTCYRTITYDQSGNGHDTSDTAQINAPTWGSVGQRTAQGLSRWLSYNVAAGNIHYSTLPSSVSLPLNSYGVFWAGQNKSTLSAGIVAKLGATANQLRYSLGGTLTGYPGLGFDTNGATPTVYAPTGPTFAGWWANATTIFTRNDFATASLAVGFPTTAMVGGYIGGPNTTTITDNETCAFVLTSSVMTTAQVDALHASLAQACGLTPQATGVVYYTGDSIENGYGSTMLRGWAHQAPQLTQSVLRVVNIANPGDTIAAQVASAAVNLPAIYDPLAPVFVVVLEPGINNLTTTSGQTAAQAFAAWQADAQTLVSLGPNVRLVCVTLGPVGPNNTGFPASINTISAQFNAMLLASPLCNQVADIRSNPIVGSTASAANGLYYNQGSDQIHPLDYVAAIEATIVAAAIDRAVGATAH